MSQARGFYTGGTRARDHQQPGRLHDQRPARRALDAVLQRRREDDRGADLPRERRRSGGRRVRHAPRARVPAEVPQGRGHRPGLLPPPRPQRGRRAGGHAAGDVRRSSASIPPRGSCTPSSWWSEGRDAPDDAERHGRATTAAASTTASPQPQHGRSGMIGNEYTVDWTRYHDVRLERAGAARRVEPTRCCASSAARATACPGRLHAASAAWQKIVDDRRADGCRRTDRSTGASPRRSPTRRCSTRATTSGSPARTAAAARSSIATRCCTTSRPAPTYIPLHNLSPDQPRFTRHRLAALRGGRARLRVRLLDHRSRTAW